MKVKKLENVVFYVGVGASLLSLLCTLFAPLFVEGSLAYNGFEVFGKGFLTLFSFNFANPVVLLLFFLFLIGLVCLGFWAWQIYRKEKNNIESWIKFGAAALSIIVIFSLTTGTFASLINVGGTDKVLFDTLKVVAGSGFTKFLVVFSLACSYSSLAACTLYAFVNFGMLNLVGPTYREMNLPVGGKK